MEDEEGKYQSTLNDTYHNMGEKTFKSLRRALPLTRQKLDWDKVCLLAFSFSISTCNASSIQVLGYKLGAELSATKGAFSASSDS